MATIQSNGSGRTKATNGQKDDWFSTINPDKMMNNAQRILSSAVNVLEEEIAAGIIAAKKLERKVIDVEDVRSDPEELMSRIRRDTHEAVDLFLDALTAITNHLGILSGSIRKETGTSSFTEKQATTGSENALPVIVTEAPVKAGETGVVHLSITNDSNSDQMTVALMKTDFAGARMQKILARHIQLQPAVLTLKPAEQKEVVIKIKVPKTCKPGHYCALLMDAKNAGIRTVVGIDVV